MNDVWNFHVWKAFAEQVFSQSLLAEHLTDDGIPLFFEEVLEITADMKLIPKVIPPKHREVVFATKGKVKYIIPIEFTHHFPFKIKKSFRCQVKQSDKRVWEFVTDIESQGITPMKRHDTYREFVNQWNPHRNSEDKAKVFLSIVAHASLNKGTRLCVCSPPGAGKNAHLTLCGIVTNTVYRLPGASPALFYTSLYYNDVLVLDEMTSMDEKEVRELEPIMQGMGDNSPEILKNKLAKNKDMQKMPLIKKSLIFTYNRKVDIGDKKFFDDMWKNIAAFRKRYPQFLIGGEVLDSPRNINKDEAHALALQHRPEIAAQFKELLYWIEHLHEATHKYDRSLLLSVLEPRHVSNIQGVIDGIDAYCQTQEEFDEWQLYLINCLTSYKHMVDIGPKPALASDKDEKGNNKLNVEYL